MSANYLPTTRLWSTLRWDIVRQFRNGFYYAALFVLLMFVLLLTPFAPATVAFMLPVVLLGSVTISTFFFMAGLVLLEKGEQSLTGLVVTPLRWWEYIAAKVGSLALLAVGENVLLATAVYGLGFNLFWWAVGLLLAAVLMSLLGFITVVRYDSLNSFLLPAIGVTSVLGLPLLDYLGVWHSWLLYLFPLQPILLLLKAAFFPVATWQLGYSLLYGGLWLLGAGWLAGRAFRRFVVSVL